MAQSTQKTTVTGIELKRGPSMLHQNAQHGIRYNLTLHDKYNKRILGFDNAHAVKHKKKKRYQGRIIEYDHTHETAWDKGTPYEFVNAEQLLQDFFNRLNQVLDNLKVK